MSGKVWSDADMIATADAIASLGAGDLRLLLKPPLIGLATLWARASHNASLRARIKAAKRVRAERLAAQTERRNLAAIDEILVLMRDGCTLAEACKSQPRFPSQNVIFDLVRKHPGIGARLKSAAAERKHKQAIDLPPVLTAEEIDHIVELIAGGALIKEAFAVARRSHATLREFLRANSGIRARINAAVTDRENGGQARGRQAVVAKRSWADADYDAALAAIRSHRGRTIHEVLGNTLPSYNSIWERARRSGGFAERYRDAIGEQIAWRRTTYAHQPKRVYQKETLRRGLNENDLYREASDLFHKGLDPDLRDDLISYVVIAVLDGELPRDEIASRGASIGWKQNRRFNGMPMDTLDRPMFDDKSVSLGDSLTSGQWSFEDAI